MNFYGPAPDHDAFYGQISATERSVVCNPDPGPPDKPMLYLISYDLRVGATNHDYHRIHEAIEAMGGPKVMGAQWAVRSDLTSADLSDYLREFVAGSDRLLLTEVTANNWASYNAMFNLNAV